MSVLKIAYGHGEAGVFLDLLKGDYQFVGPENAETFEAHPCFMRRYQSQSGLSGELLFANNGLMLKATTYRPQHREYPSVTVEAFPLYPVNRHDAEYGYPVVLAVDSAREPNAYDTFVVSITTHVTGMVIYPDAELGEPDDCKDMSMVVKGIYGDDLKLIFRVNHYGGSLDGRVLHTAIHVAARYLKDEMHTLVFKKSNGDEDGKRHPLFSNLWQDELGRWFVANQYGLLVNLESKSDPVLAWIESGKRPFWAPTDSQPYYFSEMKMWAKLCVDHVYLINDEGRCVADKRIETLEARREFLLNPESLLSMLEKSAAA